MACAMLMQIARRRHAVDVKVTIDILIQGWGNEGET